MNLKTINNDVGASIRTEKLYTQTQVDDLFEKRDNRFSSQAAEKQKRSDDGTIANLVRKSNRILVSISSHVFPFDFFPNVINVEEGRITIINRRPFSSEVHSVDIKDISNIFINTSVFFSQLVIISKTFEENEINIRNLWTREAIFVRRIIEGLRIFVNKQIDTSNYTREELIAKLEELSTTKIVM